MAGMGTSLMESQAREGLKLFGAEEALDVDQEAAAEFKAQVDARIAALEEEAAKLTGKDNKKERSAKGKEAAELKADPQYVDACKVARGLEPKHGFFLRRPAAERLVPDAKREPKPPAKPDVAQAGEKKDKEKEKKSKKEESAGLSPAETRELERLKDDIVNRKEQLKAEGLSGSQQNKDPQVVDWVARMTELKEKQEPGSTKKDAKKPEKKSRAPLSSEEQKELDKLKGELEAYRHRLKTEFGYSNKDIKADPELTEMEARLAALEKREG